MCALCSVLGSSNHWTDMAGRSEFSWNGNKVTRRLERNRRVSLLKPLFDHYDLELKDWGGSTYLLGNVAGEFKEVYQLSGIWAVAEELIGNPCDPLDPRLIKRLSGKDA